MTASEKLKALDEQLAPRDAWLVDEDGTLGLAGGNMIAAAALRRALPQIVAVVEAAEQAVRFDSVASSLGIEPARKLYAALIVLDEALA